MDLKFKRLTNEDIKGMLNYFRNCNLHLSDYSAAFKVMWQDYFTEYFAEVEGCIVFKEYFQGKTFFHYPLSLGDDECESKALDKLEEYCRQNNVMLHFTAVPKEKLCRLIMRYGAELKITNRRRWRDYLYVAHDFVNFSGKKFSGQRNHINKFKKLYPDYQYVELSSADEKEISSFLKEFESRQLSKGTAIAREEFQSAYKLSGLMDELGLCAGGLRVGEKLIAYSVGEKCGDQLIIHIEKALTEYEGVYAVMCNEFARHNVTAEIKYINREDDAGDRGLRKSKLQYNPVGLVDKYSVFPHRAIDGVSRLPELKGERVILREIDDMVAVDFYKLEIDEERNKYWGYNWREHYSGEPTPEYFLRGVREDFKNKHEMPLGIFYKDMLIGEVVLHNFGYRNDCEIGVRLIKGYEGKGFAKEALENYISYAFFELDIEIVFAKCYKENARSRKTLLSVGMKSCGEDDRYFYFKKTAAM